MYLIMEGFLSRYPTSTRSGYRIHITQWLKWCEENNIDPVTVKRTHIEMWSIILKEELNFKPQTVAAKLNAVCGLYKFAHIDGFVPINPGAYVRRPKIDFVSSTEGLTRPEFADMLKAAEKESIQNKALLSLLGLNGLRIGECLETNVEHLGYQSGYRTLYLPERKGGKIGLLSLSVPVTWTIEKTIENRLVGPIFLGKDGTRLKPGAARRTISRLAVACGITKRITPHSFRHTFVTMGLDAGVSERDLIDSTGHGDTRMLRYYDRNRGSVHRNATHAVTAYVGAF
jgi:site-specific recombinase XerD